MLLFIFLQQKLFSAKLSSLSFICSRIKKRRKPRVKIVTLKLCGVRKSRYSLYGKHPTCAAQADRRGENTREGTKSGAARLGRMKRGRGMNDRDDKSSGIEIRMADVLAKINPTDPLILT